jgi:hypothetical protein
MTGKYNYAVRLYPNFGLDILRFAEIAIPRNHCTDAIGHMYAIYGFMFPGNIIDKTD